MILKTNWTIQLPPANTEHAIYPERKKSSRGGEEKRKKKICDSLIHIGSSVDLFFNRVVLTATASKGLHDRWEKWRWTLRAIIFPCWVTAEPGENMLMLPLFFIFLTRLLFSSYSGLPGQSLLSLNHCKSLWKQTTFPELYHQHHPPISHPLSYSIPNRHNLESFTHSSVLPSY